ncbi:ribulose-phosphate 3-epimerase [Mycobacterium heckeshornense]|uniref:Putative PPE family protein PPE29 n=1 Tax=Mycobacterium heckeshornense TaxID=110505 RepID=A0A7R7YRJ2_9MYCO|nr:putative PPE family protein PPE29 [Mycobacterium heckeshornense]BCQ09106.1 ribulose-phosphate 3-epimerase [Mycobacterium heckeshornense]
MIDFGALPPEINSGRMYAGPGSGPMLAAAAAWDGLAAQLNSTAVSYSSAIANVAAQWQGPSSTMMTQAAAAYAAWMSATGVQAEQTAAQAKAAAAAYQSAFAATVPPPVIAANRAQLTALVATNVFGQNTPAIMATEAQYAEMWAQDAAAMYGYAAASAAATRLTPFTPPPQTTNAGSGAGQAAAVAQAAGTSAGTAESTLRHAISTLPQALQGLAAPTSAAPAAAADPPNPVSSLLTFITGPTSPISYFPIGGVPYLLAFQNYLLPTAAQNYTSIAARVFGAQSGATGGLLEGGLDSGTRLLGSSGGVVAAGMGRAGFAGGLSVPGGWAVAAPAIRPVAAALPESGQGGISAAIAADSQGSLFSNMALSSLAGRAMVGTGGATTRPLSLGGGAASSGSATSATIIVIPDDD